MSRKLSHSRTLRAKRKAAKPIETKPSWATRVRESSALLIAEITVICAAVVGLFLAAWQAYEQNLVNAATLNEIRESATAREEEAVARAWSILTTAAPGNSGKRQAIEFLVSRSVPLNGIDLSCEAMDGNRGDAPPEGTIPAINAVEGCLRPVFLESLAVPSLENAQHDFSGANFSRTILSHADFSFANLQTANLSFARLDGADLEGAILIGANLTGSVLVGANLSGAFLDEAILDRTVLYGANISNAVLNSLDFPQPDPSWVVRPPWAWSDQPPLILFSEDFEGVEFCVFDPEVHYRTTRPLQCVGP